MPNSFTNSTTGTSPASSRGTQNTNAATPITLGDAQQMDLTLGTDATLGEIQGSTYIFRNGFNQKQPQVVSRV